MKLALLVVHQFGAGFRKKNINDTYNDTKRRSNANTSSNYARGQCLSVGLGGISPVLFCALWHASFCTKTSELLLLTFGGDGAYDRLCAFKVMKLGTILIMQ